MSFKSQAFLLVCLSVLLPLEALQVEVYFNLDEPSKKQESALCKKSDLYLGKAAKYNSIFAIKSQAYEDAEAIAEQLRSIGYLEAKVEAYVDAGNDPISVIFNVHAGEIFYLHDLKISSFPSSLNPPSVIDEVASYKYIESIEQKVLSDLKNQGYFFAKIHKTKIVIQKAPYADLVIDLEAGEKMFFGATILKGLNKVNPQIVLKKIRWQEKELFNASLLTEVQRSLLDTELFSQVTIEPLPPEGNTLPMVIEVSEAKFKTLSLGVSYQTHFGAGGDVSFEHRNLLDSGQKLKLETSLTQHSVLGLIEYRIPSLIHDNESLIWKIEATRESLQPSFSDNLYDLGVRLEKMKSPKTTYMVGISSRLYQVQHSVMNGAFPVVAPSFHINYDSTSKNLDPKNGIKCFTGFYLFQNLNNSSQYVQGSLKTSFYTSFFKEHVTFAEQIYASSFFLSNISPIPIPLRFFGGTDEYLRGYKYYTVSPLEGNKPIGGKSALFFNTELRLHIHDPFGAVLFYDSGFVSKHTLAPQESPYYQSVGFGVRYFSIVGPLRIDVGFPLNPRKNLDPKFKILASFGHTF